MMKHIHSWFKHRYNSLFKCSPGKQRGLHGVVITGLGLMGDSCLCLRCGAEHYEPMFGEHYVKTNEDNFAEQAAARALPGGMNARVETHDPEFEAWWNSPLKDGSKPPWAP